MSSVRVVLARPRDPNNIGAVARAMKNFGCRDLWVVAPLSVTWDEVTAAPHAMDVVTQARVVATLAEALADCTLVIGTGDATRAQGHTAPCTPRALSELLSQASQSVALVFGNEKHGLTNDDLSHCHRLMTIPTQADCPSMNLGQAVAVCLYELTRDKSADVPPQVADKPTAGATEAAVQLAMEVCQQAGFILPGNDDDLTQRVRAVLLRYDLSQHDLILLCGMLRKTRNTLRLFVKQTC